MDAKLTTYDRNSQNRERQKTPSSNGSWLSSSSLSHTWQRYWPRGRRALSQPGASRRLASGAPSDGVDHDQRQRRHKAWQVLHERHLDAASRACIYPEPPAGALQSARGGRGMPCSGKVVRKRSPCTPEQRSSDPRPVRFCLYATVRGFRHSLARRSVQVCQCKAQCI